MARTLALFLIVASAATAVPRYFASGFAHILPHGPDHILFILGLFFLNRSFPALLLQMTIFTLAHSLTLGLALYGMVSAPVQVVEIAIALSIAFVGFENLSQRDFSRWRPAVVFCCGLIHGLGFAHSFAESPVAPAEFLAALFSFNLGIEFGQIAVVALATVAVAAWWRRDFYRSLIARPASVAIAASGVYWAVERSF